MKSWHLRQKYLQIKKIGYVMTIIIITGYTFGVGYTFGARCNIVSNIRYPNLECPCPCPCPCSFPYMCPCPCSCIVHVCFGLKQNWAKRLAAQVGSKVISTSKQWKSTAQVSRRILSLKVSTRISQHKFATEVRSTSQQHCLAAQVKSYQHTLAAQVTQQKLAPQVSTSS